MSFPLVGCQGSYYRGRFTLMAQGQKSASPSAASSIMTVVKSAYSLDRLYTDSTDNKGHYEQFAMKVTPAVEALMQQAVDDNLDYRGSVQAFTRDAVIHRLHYLHHNVGSTINPISLAQEIMRAEMQATIAADAAVSAQCEMMTQVVDICVGSEDWGTLNSLIEKIEHDLETIDFPPGHREQLHGSIEHALHAMSTGRAPRTSRK